VVTHPIDGKQVRVIADGSAVVHAGLVAMLLAYPGVLVMKFLQHFDPQGGPGPTPVWIVWIVAPLMFALTVTLCVVMACGAYNLVAKLAGGVRDNK
jgi:hypothetical protein